MTDPTQNADQTPLMIRALRGQTLDRPPVWFMRQAGRYLPEYRRLRAEAPDFIAFCLNPEMAAEATLQPMRRFGFDAAIVFADILLIPRALGQDVWFETGEGPRLGEMPIPGRMAELAPSAGEHLSAVGETLSIVRAALEPERALIGFAGAPWTVATYMLDGEHRTIGKGERAQARSYAYADPKRVDETLEVLVEATARYLKMQADSGAQVLKIFESWAEGLPDDLFERLVLKPHQALVRRTRELGVTVPLIGFPRGSAALAERYAEQVEVDAVALDTACPLEVGKRVQRIKPIQGALDRLDPLHPLADFQRTGGVERDGVHLDLFGISLCKRRRAPWEADQRHGDPQLPRAPDKRLVGLQDQAFEQIVGEPFCPALENLQHLGAAVGLHLQIPGRGLDQNLQRLVHPLGIGISVGAGLGAFALADGAMLAVQHIGRHRPRRAGEPDQGALGLQRRTHDRQGFPHSRQMLARRRRQLGHPTGDRHFAKPGPFPRLEPDVLAQGARDQQNVGEDDGRIEAETPHGLKRRLGRHLGVQAEGDEVRRLGPQPTVLGQIPTGLTHEPDGRTIQSLSSESPDHQGCLIGVLGRIGHAGRLRSQPPALNP